MLLAGWSARTASNMDALTSYEKPIKKQTLDGREQQRRRREDALSRQKARRAAQLAGNRTLPPALKAEGDRIAAAVGSSGKLSNMAMPPPGVENTGMSTAHEGFSCSAAMDTSSSTSQTCSARRQNGPADQLMSAEWMVDVPCDLSRSWYVALRPSGKRCLVVTAAGSTRAHWRHHGKPRTFPSSLPNGSRASRAGLAECELDCIYAETEQTYYVVDVLCWKGTRLVDCPSELRLWWMHSKLSECKAEQTSSTNPCRFVPLGYAPCTSEALRAAYHTRAPMASADPDVSAMDDGRASSADGSGGGRGGKDGLLLLHREALYEAGPSPLLLSWADNTCSARFYDYGSAQMAAAVASDPSKAAKWRTNELNAAICFEELLRTTDQPLHEPFMEQEDVCVS